MNRTAGACRSARSTAAATSSSSRSASRSATGSSSRARSTRSATSSVSSSSWATTSVRSRAWSAAPRPPRPSTSRLVRSEVSGVRSSCDASATSRRCARCEASSASSIVLNAPASRDSSSSPSRSIRRVRSRVRATCSAASVSSATGRTAVRVAIRASRIAAATPSSTITPRPSRSVPSVWSTSSSERATWSTSPPPVDAVYTRRWRPSRSTSEKNGASAPDATAASFSSDASGTGCSPGGTSMPPPGLTSWRNRTGPSSGDAIRRPALEPERVPARAGHPHRERLGVAERGVDLVAQRVADEPVRQARREHHRERDRRRARHHQAAPEAHGARRT